jgi:hypothetical protein
MLSYRESLSKIGIPREQRVSYSEFWLPPTSLRALIRSADVPDSWTETVPGHQIDKSWTDEIQGCAWGHGRWFFTSYHPSRLYVFDGETNKKVRFWDLEKVPQAPRAGSEPHFGHIILNGNEIYIDHFFQKVPEGMEGGGQVLVLTGDGETIAFSHWIKLDNVSGNRVGLLAINFERQYLITCTGDPNISEVFLHSIDGTFTGRRMLLDPPISDNGYAQGGIWSPNNHLYISSGKSNIGHDYQYIYCYSPLNGKLLGNIPVPAFSGSQELEGICYANVRRNGLPVQVHAVLLENELGDDDIFHKSFSADKPDLI